MRPDENRVERLRVAASVGAGFWRVSCVVIAVLLLGAVAVVVRAQATRTASVTVDARRVENRISPLLYGQFLEFM